jgi:hypothetical protein
MCFLHIVMLLRADRAYRRRHAAFLSRLSALAPNSPNAVAATKAAIRSYRSNESAARDLIQTVFSVLDRELDDTATVVGLLVDLLEDEEKKRDLLGAWNGFKVEQRRAFPDLVPTAIGAGFAGVTSGRVLTAKSATATRAQARPAQVWDRVAQAAASSSTPAFASSGAGGRHVPGAAPPPPVQKPTQPLPERFPPLHPAAPAVVVAPARNQAPHKTAWSASGGGGSSSGPSGPGPAPTPAASVVVRSVPGPGAAGAVGKGKAKAPVLNSSAFPTLPAAAGGPRARPQVGGNQSLRKIVGEPAPVTNPWAGGTGASGAAPENSSSWGAEEQEDEQPTAGGKKKGKGKQKQTLFTLGAFPS